MEKFFRPVCKTIRPDRRISFLRNPFCTMDANFPRSARQTDNSFFYFYFFSIPTSRATRFSPGNVVPAGTGCNKKYADGNKKMATVPLSGGSGSGSLSNSRGSIPGRVVPVTSRASLVAGATASLTWTLPPTRHRNWSAPSVRLPDRNGPPLLVLPLGDLLRILLLVQPPGLDQPLLAPFDEQFLGGALLVLGLGPALDVTAV